ncbi:MAG: hypothetical protein A3J76_04170 [Candidatus Moranbacteria bacterium RBG_13_45_13]|nr:MAG: hypothetical protein A3J76_04170 [Candidatus Moranbacteria bacterium RBG_13_45_13]
METKNLYLDIDGVLITKNGKPANYLADFLSFIVFKFNCCWLTTHCKGEAKDWQMQIFDKFPAEFHNLLKDIKPTNWNTLKTEAIDLEKDFIWLDDYIMEAEKKVLEKNNCLEKFIQIDLSANPTQLKKLMSMF